MITQLLFGKGMFMKFTVNRSITINASHKKVRNLITDFKHWSKWSPWTIAEPDCDIDVSGKPEAIGHEMTWNGKIIGSGKNTLVHMSDDMLGYSLEFIKPFASKAEVSFKFTSKKSQTHVTWIMNGNMPFFMFFMIPMMKGWISMDYDRGLKMLKSLAETGKIQANTSNKGIVQLTGFSYVGLKRTTHMDDMGTAMQKDFDKIIDDVINTQGKSAEHWLSLYPKINMGSMEMSYVAAVSDENLKDIDLGSDYVNGSVATGQALEIYHKGSYEFIGNAWSMGMMYIRAMKLKQHGAPFEHYWNSPKEVSPEKLKTSVYFPLK